MSGIRVVWVVLAAVCVLQGAVLAGEDEDTGMIRGRVTHAWTGELLYNASVWVPGTTANSRTDMSGLYLLVKMPPGVYSVQASMEGSQSVTVTEVEVSAGKTTTVNFELLRWWDVVLDTIDFGPDSLQGTVSPPVDVRLWAEESVFAADEEVYLHCEIKNISPNALFLIRRVVGSQHKRRLPYYHISLIDSTGKKFEPRVEWLCNLLNRIKRTDFVLLRPGEAFRPYGERVELEKVVGGAIPSGKYLVRLHFKCTPELAKDRPEPVMKHMVDCDITTEPVEITILGE